MAHEAVRDFMKRVTSHGSRLPGNRAHDGVVNMARWRLCNKHQSRETVILENMYSFMFVRRLHILPNVIIKYGFRT